MKILATKNALWKIVLFSLILSLLLNIYFAKENSYKEKVIRQCYSSKIGYAILHLNNAYITNPKIDTEEFSTRINKKLSFMKSEIKFAEEDLYNFGKYFAYQDKYLQTSGAMYAKDYLRAFRSTLEYWITAIEEKNKDQIPSTEDIVAFRSDLKNTIDKLKNLFYEQDEHGNYRIVIKDLSDENFRAIFTELARETKCKILKDTIF